jgi:hypothetical protein
MTNDSGANIKVVLSAVATLFAAARTAAYADDSIDSAGPTYKPRRTIDDASNEPRRAFNDEKDSKKPEHR